MTQSVMSMATKKAAAAQVRPSLTGGAPVRDSFDSPSWALSHFSLLVPKVVVRIRFSFAPKRVQGVAQHLSIRSYQPRGGHHQPDGQSLAHHSSFHHVL
mmetsp:Transcript_5184/g.15660  ORF Transcript_5184/g.15660 Transcript_5184/m.15660 type:complete len:99 (-) Transcript_5184:204-500(-)